MYIDLDIEEIIIEAVNDYLADGGEVATYDELADLTSRITKLEELVKDLDFWKADRNHSHPSDKEVAELGKKLAASLDFLGLENNKFLLTEIN